MLIVHAIVTERGLHPSASAIWDVVSDLLRTISRMNSRLAGSGLGAILRSACSPAPAGRVKGGKLQQIGRRRVVARARKCVGDNLFSAYLCCLIFYVSNLTDRDDKQAICACPG